MAGLFDFFGGGGDTNASQGLFGWFSPQQRQAAAQQATLEQVLSAQPQSGSMFGPGALMGAGFGVLGSDPSNPNEMFGKMGAGMMQGMNADTARQLKELEAQKQFRAVQGLRLYAGALKRMGVPEDEIGGLLTNPEKAADMFAKRYEPVTVSAGDTRRDPLDPSKDYTAPMKPTLETYTDPTDGQQKQRVVQLPKSGQLAPGGYRLPTENSQGGTGEFVKALSPDMQKALEKRGEQLGERSANVGSLQKTFQVAMQQLDISERKVAEVLKDPDLGLAVGRGNIAPWATLSGSRAANMQAKLSGVESSAMLDALQAMRNQSPTGGAIGQVTEREYPILKNKIAALNREQDPNEYRKALADLKQYYSDLKQTLQQEFEEYMKSVGRAPGERTDRSQARPPNATGTGVRWRVVE